MANFTPNYNLEKPLQTEAYDVDVFNGNMDTLDTALAALSLKLHPVGSVYFSVDGTNPGSIFGGTWVQIEQGRFIRSAGKDIAALSTGGADNVTLKVENLPSHAHSATCSTDSGHNHTGTTSANGNHNHMSIGWGPGSSTGIGDTDSNNGLTVPTSYAGDHSHNFTTDTSGAHSHTITIGNTGSGTSFSIVNSYIALYMWYRTA